MGMGRREIYRVKAADEHVNNSDVLQDDNDLTCQVQAGTTYAVRMLVHADATVNSPMIQFSAPAGATFRATIDGAIDPEADWDNSSSLRLYTGITEIVGYLRVGSTAGTFKLQWAQRDVTVGNTTLKAGSYMILERLN